MFHVGLFTSILTLYRNMIENWLGAIVPKELASWPKKFLRHLKIFDRWDLTSVWLNSLIDTENIY